MRHLIGHYPVALGFMQDVVLVLIVILMILVVIKRGNA